MDKEKKNSKRYRSQNKEKKQVFNKKMNLKKKKKNTYLNIKMQGK